MEAWTLAKIIALEILANSSFIDGLTRRRKNILVNHIAFTIVSFIYKNARATVKKE